MKNEVIERAIEYLEEEPASFDMKNAVVHSRLREADVLEHPQCGTACCLAGAIVLSGRNGEKLSKELIECGTWMAWQKVRPRAKRSAALTDDEAEGLFHVDHWPKKYRTMYRNAKTPIERVYSLRTLWNAIKKNPKVMWSA